MTSLKDKIDKNNIPNHVAIIMDGNGRWAQKHDQKRTFGHEHGVHSVRSVVEGAAEIGIKYLTLYAFSTENWNRPQTEVAALMNLLVQTIDGEKEELKKNNVRLAVIGNLNMLDKSVKKSLDNCIEYLDSNTGLTLVIALSYSSHWEMVEMVKQIAQKVQNSELKIENINKETIDRNLATKDIPNPDLLIRTSGEYRISNFLLWQIAYTELYFTDTLWPDYRKKDLFSAVINFQNRERRFGKTSQQLEK